MLGEYCQARLPLPRKKVLAGDPPGHESPVGTGDRAPAGWATTSGLTRQLLEGELCRGLVCPAAELSQAAALATTITGTRRKGAHTSLHPTSHKGRVGWGRRPVSLCQVPGTTLVWRHGKLRVLGSRPPYRVGPQTGVNP